MRARACGAPTTPPTTPFLTPAYQLASLAALGTLALARLRRASHLSLSLVSAHACGARTHLRALTTLLCNLAYLAALDTLASARLRRALSLSLFLSLSLSLPLSLSLYLTSECARLRRAFPPPPSFHSHPAMSARFARSRGHSRVGAPAARIAPFSFPFHFSLSLSLFLFLSLSLPLSFLIS